MKHYFKIVSAVLSLAMLSASLAYCQEPPAAPTAAESPAAAPADSAAVREAPVPAATDPTKPVLQTTEPDTAAATKAPAKKPGAWKPGKIEIDRNGKIFIGASLALLGGVYLVYQVFKKDVK